MIYGVSGEAPPISCGAGVITFLGWILSSALAGAVGNVFGDPGNETICRQWQNHFIPEFQKTGDKFFTKASSVSDIILLTQIFNPPVRDVPVGDVQVRAAGRRRARPPGYRGPER